MLFTPKLQVEAGCLRWGQVKLGSHMLLMYLEVVARTAWTASRANENMRRRQQDPSQNFTPGMSAKLDSNQLRRHAGDKDWDDRCCRPLVFSYQNSIPGHVAGASVAYENQA